MRTDGGTANAQQGIFMDNGSGGWMTDLVFNGLVILIFIFMSLRDISYRELSREHGSQL